MLHYCALHGKEDSRAQQLLPGLLHRGCAPRALVSEVGGKEPVDRRMERVNILEPLRLGAARIAASDLVGLLGGHEMVEIQVLGHRRLVLVVQGSIAALGDRDGPSDFPAAMYRLYGDDGLERASQGVAPTAARQCEPIRLKPPRQG